MAINISVRVPFVDLVTPHVQLEAALLDVVGRALRPAQFIGGPMVEGFEQRFAAFCDVGHCVGVASGTDALRFALMAAGVARGDTVITVANTFIATVEAICQSGARPAFVDVDADTLTLDPVRLRDFLENACTRDPGTGRWVTCQSRSPVSAIVPVHLYGQMADMDEILDLAAEYDLLVVEDACQAHGAAYFSERRQQWCQAGAMGDAAAFSFYPGKNLGACGEAGAMTTNEAEVAERCRMLRNHGQSRKYVHDVEGYNGRLDAIQAGMLDVKLPLLSDWNERRRAVAARYDAAFADHPSIVAPHTAERTRPVFHLYVVRVPQREAVQMRLADAGIETGIHYPIPLHRTAAYADAGFAAGDLAVTERAAAQILSLPMFPTLGTDDQRYVIERLLEFVAATPLEFA